MPLLLSTTRRAVWSASHVSKQQPYQPHLTTIRLQRALRQQGLGGELAHPRQRRRCSNSYSKSTGLASPEACDRPSCPPASNCSRAR